MRFAALLASLTAALPAAAQTYTWNAATGTWGVPANWVEAVVPPPAATTQLTFNDAAAGYTSTNDVGAYTALNRLVVGNTGSGEVVVASAASANSLTFAGTTPTFDITGLARVTAPVVGAAALTKAGTGTLALTGANTFAGGLTVAAGTLEYAGPTVTSATTAFGGFPAGTVTSSPVGTGALFLGAGATLATDGANRFLRNTLTVQGTTAAPSVIRVAAGEFTTSGAFNGGTAAVLNKTGAGLLRLTSGSTTAGSSVGTLTIDAGTVLLTDPTNGAGGGGDLGSASIVVNNTGTFVFGTSPAFTGENPDLPNSTLITARPGGTVEWNVGEDFGGVLLDGGALNLRAGVNFAGTGAAQNDLRSGTITALAGAPGIGGSVATNKTTAGTVTVSGAVFGTAGTGANNNSPLNIQEGVLATNGGFAGTGAITLGTAATAGTLRYTGASAAVARPLTVAGGGGAVEVTQAGTAYTLSGGLSGAGPLAKAGPGTLSLTGTLGQTGLFTAGAGTTLVPPVSAAGPFAVGAGGVLAVNSGTGATPFTTPALGLAGSTAVLRLDLNTSGVPAGPLVSVTGPDALTGGGTLRLTNAQPLANGTYQLVDYAGGPITSGFALEPLGGRSSAVLQYNTADTRLDAVVTADSIRWGGQLSNVWDKGTAAGTGGTFNFRLASNGASTNYVDTDTVTFDDNLTANPTINLTTIVLPSAVLFNNTNAQYEIGGSGSIGGAAALTKQGTNTLILTTTNDYTGGTTVQAGTLQLGAGGTVGSVAGTITGAAGGALAVSRSDDLTLANPLTGGLAITKLGANTLTLTGANTFTGGLNLNSGVVAAATVTALGDVASPINFNGGTLRALANLSFGTTERGWVVTGSGTVDTGTFTVSRQANLTGSGTLTKLGAGVFSIGSAQAAFSGTYAIAAGTLRLTSPQISAAGGLTIAPGATFEVNDDIVDTFSLAAGGLLQLAGTGVAGGGAFRLTAQSATSPTATFNRPVVLTANALFTQVNGTTGVSQLTLSEPVTGSFDLTKNGTGRLVLASAGNTFGRAVVQAGTLQLGAANALPATASVQLAGGTLSSGATTGFAAAAGTLSVPAAGTLALGTGDHTLTFAGLDSTGFAGLTITGWAGTAGQSGTDGKLVFTDPSQFSPAVLSAITFQGYDPGAVLIAGNELVPVPEPALLLAVAAGGLVVRRLRR